MMVFSSVPKPFIALRKRSQSSFALKLGKSTTVGVCSILAASICSCGSSALGVSSTLAAGSAGLDSTAPDLAPVESFILNKNSIKYFIQF